MPKNDLHFQINGETPDGQMSFILKKTFCLPDEFFMDEISTDRMAEILFKLVKFPPKPLIENDQELPVVRQEEDGLYAQILPPFPLENLEDISTYYSDWKAIFYYPKLEVGNKDFTFHIFEDYLDAKKAVDEFVLRQTRVNGGNIAYYLEPPWHEREDLITCMEKSTCFLVTSQEWKNRKQNEPWLTPLDSADTGFVMFLCRNDRKELIGIWYSVNSNYPLPHGPLVDKMLELGKTAFGLPTPTDLVYPKGYL